ncbi:MAG: hypothetical protein L0H86_09430 [Micrococcaceae bacterium]|nr:hypothetical protein [Micrococcaceae bacterium]MDN5878988.1 hypothetical protein [Micrococcaceae bacterium]MDN5905833.1 hypothetical protein [Micrococcaceae bacterium]
MSTAETDKTKINALRRRKQSEPASIADSFKTPTPTGRAGATKRLNVEVPADLHTFLKMKAARDNTEVRRLTVAALLEVYGPEFEQQKNL